MKSNDTLPAAPENETGKPVRGSRPYRRPLLTSADWPNSTNISAKPTPNVEFTTTYSPYHQS